MEYKWNVIECVKKKSDNTIYSVHYSFSEKDETDVNADWEITATHSEDYKGGYVFDENTTEEILISFIPNKDALENSFKDQEDEDVVEEYESVTF